MTSFLSAVVTGTVGNSPVFADLFFFCSTDEFLSRSSLPMPNLSYLLGTSENILAQYFSQGGKFRSSYFKIYFLGRIMELL